MRHGNTRSNHGHRISDSGLFGGEPGLENPVYRQLIETTWGMKAQNANYGVSDVLCNFASVCLDNYKLHFLGQGALLLQIILNHPSPYTGLDIKVEHGIHITPDKMIDLKLKIEKKIKETLNFKGIIELVKPDSIERSTMGKARRVIRNY